MNIKKTILTASLISLTGLFSINTLASDKSQEKPQQNWQPIEKVLKNVQNQGYSEVYSISRTKNGYEIKAQDKDGKPAHLYIDNEKSEIKQLTKKDRKDWHNKQDKHKKHGRKNCDHKKPNHRQDHHLDKKGGENRSHK